MARKTRLFPVGARVTITPLLTIAEARRLRKLYGPYSYRVTGSRMVRKGSRTSQEVKLRRLMGSRPLKNGEFCTDWIPARLIYEVLVAGRSTLASVK